MQLYDYQLDAVKRLKTGKVLCGRVGSGKSLTALYWWHTKVCGGSFQPWRPRQKKVKLYIITTAKKREDREWQSDALPFLPEEDEIVVDSWQNIKKYIAVTGCCFIFDEQKTVSTGTWSKNFVYITKHNKWIMLSGTPGDAYKDYLALFIANGFVKNKTEFNSNYVKFARFSKYPKIEGYYNVEQLESWRRQILVVMKDHRKIRKIFKDVFCEYDRELYLKAVKLKRDVFTDEPCMDAGHLCRVLRKIVNSDLDRIKKLDELLDKHHKAIVFYNFNFERDMLREYAERTGILYSEYNGERHESAPIGDKWIYAVQYVSCEGWNLTTTDTVIFFSQNYSYKVKTQAAGRIDRVNTPFNELYYYTFMSNSTIDYAIWKALNAKKNFQESAFEDSDYWKEIPGHPGYYA